jgi:hypothetical protein
LRAHAHVLLRDIHMSTHTHTRTHRTMLHKYLSMGTCALCTSTDRMKHTYSHNRHSGLDKVIGRGPLMYARPDFVCVCTKSVQTLVRDTLVFKKDHGPLHQSAHATLILCVYACSQYKLSEWNEWSSGPMVQTLSHGPQKWLFNSSLSIKLTQTQ